MSYLQQAEFIPKAPTDKGNLRIGQILKAASEIAYKEGVAELSVRNVARRSGLRVFNVQHYFPSQEMLIRATLGRVLMELEASAHAYLETRGTLSPVDEFQETCRYYLRVNSEKEMRAFWCDLNALAQRNDSIKELLAQAYMPYRHHFETLLKKIRPTLSDALVSDRALIVAAMIEGTIFVHLAPDLIAGLAHEEAFLLSLLSIAMAG